MYTRAPPIECAAITLRWLKHSPSADHPTTAIHDACFRPPSRRDAVVAQLIAGLLRASAAILQPSHSSSPGAMSGTIQHDDLKILCPVYCDIQELRYST